ncbi:MAG: hypothetical protein KKA19_06195 [Candidatus Margulisbacteria bacterium]|nr:hypothetical protein [Candidatus Margulisiibacteriota bacterium]
MATTKKNTTKKKPTSKSENTKVNAHKSQLVEIAESIEAGAKIVGEKTSVIAGDAFEKIKKGAEDIFESGSKVVSDLYHTAGEYTETFKDKVEMSKLKSEKERLTRDLGSYFYVNYQVDGLTFKEISVKKEFKELMKKIGELDHQIIDLGKKLTKANK